MYIQDDNFPTAKTNMDSFKTSVSNSATNMETLKTKTDNSAKSMTTLKTNANDAASKLGTVKTKIDNIPSSKSSKINITLNATVKASGSGKTSVSNPTINLKPTALFAAKGLIAYGDTLVNIAEYTGASHNPEVVAPLSDLSKILTNTGGGKASEQSMKEQNTLLRQQNQLLAEILNKEVTITPSAAFGQVISKSTAMFSRA